MAAYVHRHLRSKFHDLVHLIKLLRVYGLRFRVRAFLMALFVVSSPWIGSTIRGEYNFVVFNQGDDHRVEFINDNSIELEVFLMLFQNLTNEGVLGMHDKGLIVNNDDEDEKLVDYYPSIDFISYVDLEHKHASHDYDFVFTHESVESVDKFLKLDGIMVVQKKGAIKDSESLQKPSNYETLFVKQLELPTTTEMITIIAMKKTRTVGDHDKNKNEVGSNTNIPHRRLMFEQKKAEAIKNIENVVLEPPRTISGKSSIYFKKTRYLPDLMDDSFLEEYPRRVFIDVNGDSTVWFTKNYPTKNKNFEIFKLETTIPETGTKEDVEDDVEGAFVETEITDWLRENVKKDEYVVMRGEAEVVEELIKSKAIGLVDELFLECKYQGIKCQKCRRPYWKCLALYGLLKDAGVAVHQWWG
ncbi:uncharacterized protein LOC112514712 [Cynara cardunculus var. scolymus]|uniref:DUF7870 domain-containing protein n=1 Tax=Cynara cardunculus var. scolymus TaxID=59895 RepID=A0A103XZD6_CYNCS|nr:uncharacterized protein LOC112514712 [Cynara cardunculus var. scolymus]KVH99696.1 hypothetical protein Ccrd_022063 [Cynara cardunculus var. scolymus]